MTKKKRAETPDVLGQLTARTQSSQPTNVGTQTYTQTSPQDYIDAAEDEKQRATYYFLLDTLDDLEDVAISLKKVISDALGRKYKRNVSKSLLVERAIRLIIEDYEANGENSMIVKDLMKFD